MAPAVHKHDPSGDMEGDAPFAASPTGYSPDVMIISEDEFLRPLNPIQDGSNADTYHQPSTVSSNYTEKRVFGKDEFRQDQPHHYLCNEEETTVPTSAAISAPKPVSVTKSGDLAASSSLPPTVPKKFEHDVTEGQNTGSSPALKVKKAVVQPTLAPTAERTPQRIRRSRLKLEIEDHNEAPATGDPERTIMNFEDPAFQVRRTRGNQKTLASWANGQDLPPPKNLNFRAMMKKQLQPSSGRNTVDTDDQRRSKSTRSTRSKVKREQSHILNQPAEQDLSQDHHDFEISISDEINAFDQDESEITEDQIFQSNVSNTEVRSSSPGITNTFVKSTPVKSAPVVPGNPFVSSSPTVSSFAQMNDPVSQRTDNKPLDEDEDGRAELLADWKSPRITDLVLTPSYNPNPTIEDGIAKKKSRKASIDETYFPSKPVPPGFQGSYHCEQGGIFLFKPNAEVFRDFPSFLRVVEEIAGRERGLVKIMIPDECLHHVPRGDPQAKLPAPKSTELKYLSKKKLKLFYRAFSHDSDMSCNAQQVLERIDWCRQQLLDVYDLDLRICPRVEAMIQFWAPYDESKMLRVSKGESPFRSYIESVPATPELREALTHRNPKMIEWQGNCLSASSSRLSGVSEPVFDISLDQGTVHPISINEFGAYSLHYLHHGSPRTWVNIKPEHHKKVENIIRFAQNPNQETFEQNVEKPSAPLCSQFVSHESLYIPEQTLNVYRVKFTRVVQHAGELVITFPQSYHQSFDTGANVSESMLYGSDRWKIFAGSSLYKHCTSDRCGNNPPAFDIDSFLRNLSRPISLERIALNADSIADVPIPAEKRNAEGDSDAFMPSESESDDLSPDERLPKFLTPKIPTAKTSTSQTHKRKETTIVDTPCHVKSVTLATQIRPNDLADPSRVHKRGSSSTTLARPSKKIRTQALKFHGQDPYDIATLDTLHS